ncbi:MAG: prephenate dehydratase [Solirubrobacteraceae bacterium]
MQPAPSTTPRVGYLGPEGTFSEEALLGSVEDAAVAPVALETIREAVMAVQAGEVEWSLVPIENSIEGSVTVTLDALARDASEVAIVGEVVLPVRHYLIARRRLELGQIETIVSHPHVPGQCTRFLHKQLPRVRVVAATSTAEAVRLVAEGESDGANEGYGRWAAIGTQLAGELYGCTVIAEGIQDREDNETRFVWLARTDSSTGVPPLRSTGAMGHKTSLVLWGPGADRAGWLVLCLDEFARRAINLTKIESRPMRERLGHYMFFLDLEGSLADEAVSEALVGLRAMCEQVRVLGSYPAARKTPKG